MTARITDSEKLATVICLALDAWLDLINAIFVMRATTKEALKWAKGNFRTRRPGEIMTAKL